ncbi:MAG: hypothetical protein GF364_21465, partial [Candidatus Lokiarchaeota archaeon]|nr:hypothetical protein [Candidatus Lokiarchaeota archaeon]
MLRDFLMQFVYFSQKIDYFNKIFHEYYDKFTFTNVLVRFSEIGTKSNKVQFRMVNNLRKSIKSLLEKVNVKYTRYYQEKGRIVFSFRNEDVKLGSFVILNTPGVASISPVIKTDFKMDNIIQRSVDFAQPIFGPNKEIGVKVRVVDKSKLPSEDPKSISQAVSRAILSKFPPEKRGLVNIASPDLKIYIEIRSDFTYIYSLKIDAFHSGLPVEKQRASIGNCLNRFHDFDAMVRIVRRGQHIVPVTFLTNRNKNSKNYQTLWNTFRIFYPKQHFFSFIINLEKYLSKIKQRLIDLNLENNNSMKYMCPLCRTFRFAVITEVMLNQREIILKLLKKEKWDKQLSSNIHYTIKGSKNSKSLNLRYLRGIVNGSGEECYCPENSKIWISNTITNQPIFEPNYILKKDNILRTILDLIIASRMMNALYNSSNKNSSKKQTEASINIIKSQERLLTQLKHGIGNQICDYKSELEDF